MKYDTFDGIRLIYKSSDDDVLFCLNDICRELNIHAKSAVRVLSSELGEHCIIRVENLDDFINLKTLGALMAMLLKDKSKKADEYKMRIFALNHRLMKCPPFARFRYSQAMDRIGRGDNDGFLEFLEANYAEELRQSGIEVIEKGDFKKGGLKFKQEILLNNNHTNLGAKNDRK